MFPKPADNALTDLHWRIRRFCREIDYPWSIELSDLIVQLTREAYLTGVVTNIAVTPEPITVRPVEVHAVTDSIDVPGM